MRCTCCSKIPSLTSSHALSGQALAIRFDDYQPRATEQMSKGGSDLLGRIEGGSKMRSDSGNNDRRASGPVRNGNAGYVQTLTEFPLRRQS